MIDVLVRLTVKNLLSEKCSVIVFGRSTCPFCIEVTRTMTELGIPFKYITMDTIENGSGVHDYIKSFTGQKTVPAVFINGELLGGCDATKAAIASGEFDRRLGAQPNGVGGDVEAAKPKIPLVGVDERAPRIIGALFEFPNTVDGRIIRLVAVQVFVLSVLLAVFAYKGKRQWSWVSVGLLTDFCVRCYGGAGISPLGSIAMFVAGFWDLIQPRIFPKYKGFFSQPRWGAGPPKQFAVVVGVMFSAMIVVLYFTKVWQAATVIAAILAFFAFLEGFYNFCAGCWVFGHAIRLKLIPDTVYKIHVDSLPETKYAWDDWTKQINPPTPKRTRYPFRDHPVATKIDLHYKTGKTDDVEREDFDIIRHSKIQFFSGVVGVAAIPAMFKFASMTIGVPNKVWQILTLISLVWTVVFTAPYLLKAIMYPRKIRAEWQHPGMNNAFSLPSFTILIYAFLAAENYSTALARVLFWAGTSTSTLLAIIIVGNWNATYRHDGHVNGAMMMPPIGLFVCSIVGPIIDRSYIEVSFLFFGFALIMWITLFVMMFQRTIVGHNADPRQRMFAAIWFAAPAVASIAWTVLNSPAPNVYPMDSFGKVLFYIAISMALVCTWMVWRNFLWIGKFFMGMWAWGFPTAALAWAALLYDATVNTALTKVLAVALIALACMTCLVLAFRTLGGICRLKVFVPEHRWGPLSQLPLAQEAMRALLHRTTKGAQSLAEVPGSARLLTSLRSSWNSFTTINTHYSILKREICFPRIGTYFPGHEKRAIEFDKEILDEQNSLSDMISKLKPGSSEGINNVLDAMAKFAARAEEYFDYVEDHIRPVTRRYIAGPVQVKILNDCWDLGETLGTAGWFPIIPAVLSALPMHSQRVTYLRAFEWAMPWRCQQLGIMAALGTDPVTWYRLKHSCPEIIPRGESGWKKY